MSASTPTSIGPRLLREGSLWGIDTTRLPLFHGLSVLARALGELVVEQARSARLDVDVERPLKVSENPELCALGIEGVKLLAEREVVAHVPRGVEAFQDRLRAVFGTIQMERWRRLLLPAASAPSRALVFSFPSGEPRKRFDYRFVLERVASARGAGRFHLRLTVENPRGRCLDLRSIPHAVVDDLGGRRFIAGSTRIAQTVRDLVQRAAERNRRSHFERWRDDSFVFQRLAKAGLVGLRGLAVNWSDRFEVELVEMEPERLDGALKKVLLVLEDLAVRSVLAAGSVVRVRDGDLRIYLDLSQGGRVLNLSLDEPRHRPRLEEYLDRMPRLRALVRRRRRARPLAGVRVLLIHHITSEVLGTIAGLRALGCADLTTLFVRYAGEIPNDYLEALLEVDPARFAAFSLRNVKDPEKVEGHFVLSKQFSPLGELERLDARFHAERPRYLDAMTRLAAALFSRMLAPAAARSCLVIEDGGYLAPLLARKVAEGATLGAFQDEFGTGPDGKTDRDRPLGRVLRERLLGTVEHTRNGHDRLAAAQAKHGALARPAFSIAVSRAKVEEESEEVAASVLNAVETVLQATGLVLSPRNVLVIGSRGAIGSRLMRRLLAVRAGGRGGATLGLDLKIGAAPRRRGGPGSSPIEARSWSRLPSEARRRVDLLIGVTGVSVLGAREMEELLLEGTEDTVVFASGSTKTVEFRDAAAWAERLLGAGGARIRGRRVSVSADEVTDPQTGRLYGTRYTIGIEGGRARRVKRFLFLANLTPVNFLFYGVATEAMDRILAQLASASLGLVRAVRSRTPPKNRLHAVDREIDEEGRLLPRRRG